MKPNLIVKCELQTPNLAVILEDVILVIGIDIPIEASERPVTIERVGEAD